MAKLVFFLLFIRLFQSSVAAGTCYFPNGKEAPDDHPCDPDAEDSVCCSGSFGTTCLSNKLCQGSNGNVVRGSCTDQNWDSPLCAKFCLGASAGGTDLISCFNVTDSDTSFCCDHTVNCCDSGVGRFEVQPPRPDIWATWNREETQFVTIGTMFEDQTTTSLPASSTSSTTTGDSGTSTAPPPPPTDTATTSGGPTDSDAAPALSTGAMAGIGVGAAAGALLIATVIFLVWKMRKTNRRMKESQKTSQWPPSYDNSHMGTSGNNPTGSWSQSLPMKQEGPQELQGHHFPGYGWRAELPAHT